MMSRIKSKKRNKSIDKPATGYNPIAAVIKLLLIEDNPGDARLIQEMLKEANAVQFKMTHVTNLKDGLKHLKEDTFDAVLLDLGLPDSQGLETLRSVQPQAQDVAIMVLTGLADEEVGINALQQGAQDYLIKGHINGNALWRSMRYAIERKRTEESLRKVNQALKTLSECNQALVRVADESELFNNVCHIIVETGGYRIAWVGFTEHGDARDIRLVAETGFQDEHSRTVNISWAKTESCCCPIAKVIRTGKPCICRDVLTDSDYALCREEAIKNEYASMIFLPLIVNDKILGTLNIYAVQSDVFDEDEVKLLTELADDLAYGITTLRTRIENRLNTEKVRQSEKKYRQLVETLNEGIWVFDKSAYTTFINPRMAEMLGYTVDEMQGKHLFSFMDEHGIKICKRNLDRRKKGIEEQHESELIRKDGTRIHTIMATSPMFDEEKNYVGAITGVLDITQLKNAQQELRKSLEKLQRILEQTVTSLASTLSKRDLYTAGHQQRVTKLACAIAKEMGFSKEQIDGIRIAGLLHDIGKIAVPSEILTKPGRLTLAEFNIIKTHANVGYDILKSIEFPWPIAKIVLQHHERLDGSGYPQGLKNDEILLEARILCVADVVEAMSSYRPYRPARGLGITLEEIRKNRGVLYDPQVADVCLRLFTKKDFTFDNYNNRLSNEIIR